MVLNFKYYVYWIFKNDFYRKEAVLRLQPRLLEGFAKQEDDIVPIWVTKNHLK